MAADDPRGRADESATTGPARSVARRPRGGSCSAPSCAACARPRTSPAPTPATQIRGSDSKISRMELGRVGFKERDVADLLTMYGVNDENERAFYWTWCASPTSAAGGTGTTT